MKLLFESSIVAVLRHFHNQRTIHPDDLRQELRVKILEVIPKLQAVSDDELEAQVYKILKNHVIDLIRYHRTREGIDIPFDPSMSDEYSFEDIVDALMYKCGDVFGCEQESHVKRKEIAHAISVWVENQSPRLQSFFTELLNPSALTLEKWEALQEQSAVYRQFNSIPPTTLGKMMRLPPVLVSKALQDLRFHLTCYGVLN